MRIAMATLSKSFLPFRRLLGEKIGPDRTSPRSSSSLSEQRHRDVAARYASTMRHARIYPPSRARIAACPVPVRAPASKVRRKLHGVVAGRAAKTISSLTASLEAHAWLSRTNDTWRRPRRIPRLRSEYSPSTAKAMLPYLADKQEENVAGRREEEASWKCAIARRRGSLRMGQRRCRYAERRRQSRERRRRGRGRGEAKKRVALMNEIIAREPRVFCICNLFV